MERILAGGLGTLPLAPLADLGSVAVETVIGRMAARLTSEATPSEAATLWASTYLLLGLRFRSDRAAALLEGVRGMRESTTYQAILKEDIEQGEQRGVLQEARGLLIRIGAKRLGPPPPSVVDALGAIQDREQLERLAERTLDVESWAELLEPPISQ
jgi:hypothetical protein